MTVHDHQLLNIQTQWGCDNISDSTNSHTNMAVNVYATSSTTENLSRFVKSFWLNTQNPIKIKNIKTSTHPSSFNSRKKLKCTDKIIPDFPPDTTCWPGWTTVWAPSTPRSRSCAREPSTASSWTCCSPAPWCSRRSSSTPSWSTSTSTTSKCCRL